MHHKQSPGDWEAQQFQNQTLLGLGMSRCVFVNPQDVNISQTMFDDEVVSTEFNSNRTFSFCGSEPDELTITQPSSFPSRQISPDNPEPLIEKECHTNETVYPVSYPDPEPSEHGRHGSEVKAEAHSASNDDGDLGWKSKPSRKRYRATTTKPHSSSASTAHQRKRPRTSNNVNGQSLARVGATISSRNSKILCTECTTAFSDESIYQKHMKQHHTRPFVCVFNYAGCPSTFASKNEWKRHVSSQHLALQYWLCIQDGCCKTKNPPTNRRSSSMTTSDYTAPTPPALPNGAIFNRKDLYTQHVRRMHVPPNVRKAQKQKKPTPEWDERLKSLQAEAETTRCDLPQHMSCPAAGCTQEFRGPQAWDERMEHVARHLERAADGIEPPVRFGGDSDLTLTRWASNPDVYVVRRTNGPGGWELINPLKGEVGPSTGNGKGGSVSSASTFLKEIVVAGCSDEDAEGEDDD
ncbi:hypothetical protein CCHL11_05400 [Colletotrichum chlorophyti]|uniref:C2H2-type domain-containing protein n=1 Tax=Colletotrichum chlorophyti TaxID=708187 RepID=A0A1Q8RNJ0_9PEZI|nr:hypothetical protein CCHL11_05400 [Colletotrichum chlorophyti]